MDDLISRQAVLDILREKWNMFSSADDAMQESIDTIDALPSAEKTGRWINTRPPEMSDNIVCSECGYDSIADYDYCPNCGARMIEEGE